MEECNTIRELYEEERMPLHKIAARFEVAPMTAMRAVLVAGGILPDSPTSRALKEKLIRNSGPPRTVEKYINAEGYVRVVIDEGDPFFSMGSIRGDRKHDRSRTVLEHRLVMAKKLGRALLDHETVHHKDGNRANNDPDNLELRVGKHGKGATEAHCMTCMCFTIN